MDKHSNYSPQKTMNFIRRHAIVGIIGVIILSFFYKTFFFGLIPFPGDVLVSAYKPWQSYSYLGYVPGSVPSKNQYFDTARQFYPWRTLSTLLSRQGQLPLWNPHNFSGTPLLANHQSAILYPLNLLYLLFSQPMTWTILVILEHLLALVFTYLYCRRIDRSQIASLVAGVSYAFSLFNSVFSQYLIIGHTILWLPALLWAIESYRQKSKNSYLFIIVIGLVCSFLAGHLQSAVAVWTTTAVYGFLRLQSNKSNTRRLFLFAGCFIGALGLCALQLLPTVELIAVSGRSAHDMQFFFHTLLIEPYQLIVQLIPDFFGNPTTQNYLINDTYPTNAIYVGVLPFLLAMASIVGAKKNQLIQIFLTLVCVMFVITVNSPLSAWLYWGPLRALTSNSPSNFLFIYAFAASILAAFGYDLWLSIKNRVAWTILCIPIIVIMCYVIIANRSSMPFNHSMPILGIGMVTISAALLIVKRYMSKNNFVGFLILAMVILDTGYFYLKFNPFVPEGLVFPNAPIISWLQSQTGINRIWGYGAAGIEANFTSQYQLFSPDGYDPLYPRWYGQMIETGRNGKLMSKFTDSTRSDGRIVPGFGQSDFSKNAYRKKLLRLLGVKYILDRLENGSSEKTFPPADYTLVYNQDSWRVFEDKLVLPRFFLTGDYAVISKSTDFAKMFFSTDFPLTRLILETSPGFPPATTQGTAALTKYSANQIIMQTQSATQQLLFLSDTWYPGWQATVDNKTTSILRADYAFRAIVVPAGNHQIMFTYSPASVTLGWKISITTGIILLISWIIIKNHHYDT